MIEYDKNGIIIWETAGSVEFPSLLEWAEAEIKIPSGPYAGMSFDRSRQPVLALLLKVYEESQYRRYAVTGCTQSGKSLSAFVLPVVYHACCIGETVCAGVPQQDMAHDKWAQDILPVLEQTQYSALLPKQGSGSRGGKLQAVRFLNGAWLRFLSAAGGDKALAGYTSRVLACTEVDGYDEAGGSSDEADKVSQMEGRLLAYGAKARTFLECTVSTAEGRIWREYLNGTHSACMVPCPHCGEFITIERANLTGWQDATTEGEAQRNAAWTCLICGGLFDDNTRERIHSRAVLVHDGQSVDKHGNITGDVKDTSTFSYRWSAGNNLFMDASFIAAEEWRAVHAVNDNPELAERKMCQQFWTIPPPPPKLLDETITLDSVEQRALGLPRGLVPDWASVVTVGVDIGKWICHWTATAWGMNGDSHIVNYGIMDTNAAHLGDERGIENALERINEVAETGWTRQGDGSPVPFTAGGVDSGGGSGESGSRGWAAIVYRFCRRHPKWSPTKGHGTTQHNKMREYRQPKSTGSVILKLGDGYHWVAVGRAKQRLIEFDADRFKSYIHARLQTPDGTPGTMRLFGHPSEHVQFSKHLTAEQEVHDKKLGIVRWVVLRPHGNHFFDSTVLSAVIARTKGIPSTPVADGEAQGPLRRPTAKGPQEHAEPHRARQARPQRRIRAKY